MIEFEKEDEQVFKTVKEEIRRKAEKRLKVIKFLVNQMQLYCVTDVEIRHRYHFRNDNQQCNNVDQQGENLQEQCLR